MGLTLKDALRVNPDLNPKLFLPSPLDVLRILDESPVREWLEYIAKEHTPPVKKARLLFVPCAAKKPYDPPRNILHKKLIEEVESRFKDVYMVAVSEPLALEPREHWNFRWRGYNLIYDAPFFPWITRYGYKWDWEVAEKVWNRLSLVAAQWFERNKHKFTKVIALATPTSGYRKILKRIPVEVYVPDFEPKVEVEYEENVERIYTHPQVWSQLLKALKGTSS